jgi:hypothetical protein
MMGPEGSAAHGAAALAVLVFTADPGEKKFRLQGSGDSQHVFFDNPN